MDDLISRQDVLNLIPQNISDFEEGSCLLYDVERLPSAQKKGHWIDCTSSEHMKCSVCGDRAPMYWAANRQEYDEWYSPFCPNCGADMREEVLD